MDARFFDIALVAKLISLRVLPLILYARRWRRIKFHYFNKYVFVFCKHCRYHFHTVNSEEVVMGELIQRDSEASRAITIQPQDTASRLIEVALTSGADIDKLERLLVMQQTWEAGQARKAFFQALSGFQSNLPPIKKTKEASFPTRTGGHMTYSYASLDDIAEAIRFSLKEYGLSYRFEQRFEPGGFIWVKCIVSHKDGHSEECSMPAMADTSGQKNVIQQIASSITYLRRYTLTGALGIATTDQDLDGAEVDYQGGQQQASEQPAQRSQGAPIQQPEYYPEDSFNKNFPTWKKAIESGRKTKEDVIATVESKALLTEEQIRKINEIEEPKK